MPDLDKVITSYNYGIMGPFGREQDTNSNGKRLLEFCVDNGLLVGNIWFKHKKVYQISIEAEPRTGKSITDYFNHSKEMRRRLIDVKTMKGAKLGTDHIFILVVVDMRLRVLVRTNEDKWFNRQMARKLHDKNIRDVVLKKNG